MKQWSLPLMLASGIAACTAVSGAAQEPEALLMQMLMAEDSRGGAPEGLDPLMAGLRSLDADVQRRAVRALGRLERPSFVPLIQSALESPHAVVRSEAANALGQAVKNGPASLVSGILTARLSVEADPAVRGAIARTLGRLPYTELGEIRAAESTLLMTSWLDGTPGGGDPPLETLVGVAHGLESLARQQRTRNPVAGRTLGRLRSLLQTRALPESTASGRTAARVRRLATSALVTTGNLTRDIVVDALRDPDPEVRRLAASVAPTDGLSHADPLVQRFFTDSSASVRYEALQAYGARLRNTDPCDTVSNFTTDPDDRVALLAIDLLSRCRSTASVVAPLSSWAAELPSDAPVWARTWHRPAHALVSLAQVSRDDARGLLPQYTRHQNWLVRVYAARAAALLPDVATLRTLAADEDDNVRTAAISGLVRVVGHDADSIYVAALRRPDYHLLMTAAAALEGSSSANAVPELLRALQRVTAEQRMTSRDARVAILDRVAALEGAGATGPLLQYLADFDSLVSGRVAQYLNDWTGESYQPRPELLPAIPLPSLRELADLAQSRVVIRMRGGGRFVMRLLPEEAPTNSARFARLARAGYFDGLTFHRVVPNFVVQGGSPGANEYRGDGPYTRDELGLRSHVRGTVGLSTRGRDTGDAQVFVNLVDNVRLDHNYTIFAEVVSGMEVVDAMLEGATMERVTVMGAR